MPQSRPRKKTPEPVIDGPPINALHLPAWRITGYPHLDGPAGPLLFAASPDEAPRPDTCPRCSAGGSVKRHGKVRSTIADIPAFGRHVQIRVARQRYRCGCKCGWTGCADVPEIDDDHKMTARCAAYVVQRSALQPFAHVAREVGLSETTVRTLATTAWKAIPDYEFETPRYLGIDELVLKDSADRERPDPRPRAVFVDLETGRVLDILADNTKHSVSRWIMKLPNRHRIRIVTTDLEPTYREIVKAILPDATLVVDKWHAMKGIWEALDAVRVATLKKHGQKVFNDAETLRMRSMLRAREIKPTDSQWLSFDGFLKQHPDIAIAYAVKTEYCLIWERAETLPMAMMQFLIWKGKLPHLPSHVLEHIAPVEQQLTRNMNDLLAYFDFPLTNAPTEAMNRIIRRINGAGQGLNLAALRYRVRAYSRAKQQKKFFCDRCLKRRPIKEKLLSETYMDRDRNVVYDHEYHWLCYLCEKHAHRVLRRDGYRSVIIRPKAPRIASAEVLREMRQARKRAPRPAPSHPDLFS